MNASPHPSPPPRPPNPLMAVLEAVWGPAYPLLLVLLGFPGLLALLVAAGSRDEVPLMGGFLLILAGGGALMAVCGAAWAVHRLARVQRIWAARLAPRAAGQRVAHAVAVGLGLTWFITTAPMTLLWWTQAQGLAAVAAASLLALLMASVTAWACAWQGRIGWWGLLPVGLGVAFAFILGPLGTWALWLQAGWPFHALVGGACAAALPRVLAARGCPQRWVPALAWAGLSQQLSRLGRQRYQRVQEPGEHNPSWIGGLMGPMVGSGLQAARWETPLSSWQQSGFMLAMASICVAFAYSSVCSADLHWRRWLAPGTHLRRHLGARVLRHTLVAHGRIAIPVLALAWAVALLWPWDSRAHAVKLVAEVAATLALYWLLAVPVAVWLRGLNTSDSRRVAIAIGVVLAWAAIGALLAWAGLDTRGELLLALAPLSALVLMPALMHAWARRDLAVFRHQNKTTGALT